MLLLDMDGCVCDFVYSACELHSQSVESVDCWDFYAKWGLTSEEFWAPIHDAGYEFWADLAPYPWFDELVGMVEKADPNFYICTTPSQSPESLSGKLEWIHRYFGYKFNRYFMAPSKAPLAAPGRLLIDDGDHNCKAFDAAGGEFICVPQPWNSNAHRVGERMEHIAEFLGYYQRAQKVAA